MPIKTLFLIFCTSYLLSAQTFSSGSDGSDGALDLTTPGDFYFAATAFDPPLDQDGDGIYNFTTINIAASVTVKFPAGTGPIHWLATGAVQIEGVLNLNGQDGHPNGSLYASVPGPGGFSGGTGSFGALSATAGQGPGRGLPSVSIGDGGGAGHAGPGQDGDAPDSGGSSYGNVYLLPMIGGSGGAGGRTSSGLTRSGGGAGGGAVLLASSSQITINGSILANGGSSSTSVSYAGGGGSGGAIRLVAPVVAGTGTLSAMGGDGYRADGSPGRIRLEGSVFSGTVQGHSSTGPPGLLFLSADQLPVRITAIDGVSVPNIPHGGFVPPDVTISNASPVTLDLATRGVPPGTVLKLTLVPEVGEPIDADSDPVVGTVQNGTTTATVSVPFGFARFFVQGNW